MKTIYINKKNNDLESWFFAALKLITIITVLLLAFSCSDEGCDYDDPCVESCNLFEDFEDETLGTAGNWQGILVDDLQFQSQGGSQTLFVEDGSGGSLAYNSVDFPRDLIAEGCALRLDIEYLAGSQNGLTTDNGIGIFDGTSSPLAAPTRAFFILNTSNLITSGLGPITIEAPLELATGTTLPSNSYGEWVLAGVTTPTATDIANFNALIQNITGVYFSIDEGSNPAEQWWFDNFCFKQCCPN